MSESIWILERVGSKNTRPIILRDGPNKLGRGIEENHIICHSIWVSRRHCDIAIKDGSVFIKDLGSFNGTFIESKRLEKERFIELKHNDIISLGKAYLGTEKDLPKDHYAYRILTHIAPIVNGISNVQNVSSLELVGSKRKSSSPISDDDPRQLKRFRETSPSSNQSQVSSTSASMCVVDLTDEDDNKNNILHMLKKQPAVVDLTIVEVESKPSFLSPEHIPIAHSTLLNSTSMKKLDGFDESNKIDSIDESMKMEKVLEDNIFKLIQENADSKLREKLIQACKEVIKSETYSISRNNGNNMDSKSRAFIKCESDNSDYSSIEKANNITDKALSLVNKHIAIRRNSTTATTDSNNVLSLSTPNSSKESVDKEMPLKERTENIIHSNDANCLYLNPGVSSSSNEKDLNYIPQPEKSSSQPFQKDKQIMKNPSSSIKLKEPETHAVECETEYLVSSNENIEENRPANIKTEKLITEPEIKTSCFDERTSEIISRPLSSILIAPSVVESRRINDVQTCGQVYIKEEVLLSDEFSDRNSPIPMEINIELTENCSRQSTDSSSVGFMGFDDIAPINDKGVAVAMECDTFESGSGSLNYQKEIPKKDSGHGEKEINCLKIPHVVLSRIKSVVPDGVQNKENNKCNYISKGDSNNSTTDNSSSKEIRRKSIDEKSPTFKQQKNTINELVISVSKSFENERSCRQKSKDVTTRKFSSNDERRKSTDETIRKSSSNDERRQPIDETIRKSSSNDEMRKSTDESIRKLPSNDKRRKSTDYTRRNTSNEERRKSTDDTRRNTSNEERMKSGDELSRKSCGGQSVKKHIIGRSSSEEVSSSKTDDLSNSNKLTENTSYTNTVTSKDVEIPQIDNKTVTNSKSGLSDNDVAKLLDDLETSESINSPLLSMKFKAPVPSVIDQKGCEISNNKLISCNNSKGQNINNQTNDDFDSNDIEEQIRKVVGEAPADECNVDTVYEEMNMSFSQDSSAVNEIDHDDTSFSQLFSDSDQDIVLIDDDDDEEVKPALLCSRMIKEEVDEIHEDEDIEFFESHFSQCSQDMDEKEFGGDLYRANEMVQELIQYPEKSNEFQSVSLPIAGNKSIENSVPPRRSSASAAQLQEESNSNPAIPSSSTNEVEVKPSSVSLPNLTGAKLVKSTLFSKPPETKGRNRRGNKGKPEPSATREAHFKRNQEKLKQERKAKLKSLALQTKIPDQEVETDVSNSILSYKEEQKEELKEGKILTRKVAKITDRNRSSILLEGFLDAKPQTKKPRGRPKKKPNDSLELIKVNVVEDKLKSCLRVPGKVESSRKKVSFNPEPSIKTFECEGTLGRPVNRNTSKDKISSPVSANSMNQSVALDIDDFIAKVVHWNTNWIKECKTVKGDPPVSKEVFKSKDAFVSFNDYLRWVKPMILYELWANIVKSMAEKEEHLGMRSFSGIVLHREQRRNANNLLVLKCCVPLMGKDIPSLLDPMDNLVVRVHSNSIPTKMLIMFGIVYSQVKVCSVRDIGDPCVRTYLSTLKNQPNVCAYFDVVVDNSAGAKFDQLSLITVRPTYNMMNEIRQYESLGKLKSSPLMNIVIDPENNHTIVLPRGSDMHVVSNHPLNQGQEKAVACTLQSVLSDKPTISLIHGPPGTGKTRVIVSLVDQLYNKYKTEKNRKQLILICTQSNAAVDEICLRLLDIRRHLPSGKRFRLTRFGRKERVNNKLIDFLTTSIARSEINKLNLDEVFATELNLLKAQERMISTALENPRDNDRNNYRRKYEIIQGNISKLEPIVNKTASEEARKKEIDRLVGDEELKVISHADIVATTLGSSVSRKIFRALNDASCKDERREIGVCIIDEATQATECDTLLPLIHEVKNFVLVGDPQQLPPVVLSDTCKRNGFCRSLFSRLFKVWSAIDESKLEDNLIVPVHRLTVQHRMHPEIAHFPSKMFYNDELETPDFLSVNRGFKPYAVITHRYNQELSNNESNKKEAELLIDFVDELVNLQPLFNGLSIGIIVPYQKQRFIVSELVKEKKWLRTVSVNTIDSYQGQEKDVIIMSTVRTSGVGFLSDYQRMNVAITRAKRALYIIGNFTSLQAEPVWRNLLTDAQSRGAHLDLSSTSRASEIKNFILLCKKKRSR